MSPAREPRRARRLRADVPTRRLWPAIAMALVVVVVGSISSLVAGVSIARSDARRSAQTFADASSEISSSLELSIQHESDLLLALSGFVNQNENASYAEFTQWSNALQALDRYPELQVLGYLDLVPAAGLPDFIASQDEQLPVPFALTPAGDRPYYCLFAFGITRQALTSSNVTDACANTGSAQLDAARDTGTGTYIPYELAPGVTLLGIQTPVYRGGAVPATLQERRDALLGWSVCLLDPSALLEPARGVHDDIAVVFRFRQGATDVAFRAGDAPAGAHSRIDDLNNGWTVQTFGEVAGGSLFDSHDALGLVIVGIVLSVCAATLLMVLATGRRRAIGLVRKATEELRHQALHDSLTGLPNRALIQDRIEQMLRRIRRNGGDTAVLFIDLDGFKNVNDNLGHEAGDQLLNAVATRFTASLRECDTIGRMGGDEFVVLVDGTQHTVDARLVAQRLLEVTRQPFVLDAANAPIAISASVGIAIGSRDTPGELLRDADVALYQAKDAGKNRYEVYSPQMESAILARQALEFDLRSALSEEQFHLVYQPIYNLDDLSLSGVEALLRWNHPTLGLVQPDNFIPLLESTGQIVEVGRWVLNTACAQMATWHAHGGGPLSMSVNVSGRQLDRDDIIDHVREALEASGLPPSALTIEITETALMLNIDEAKQRLARLKELGVMLAIDDFGTGYSSLAYLQQLPVDSLKIDRSFTDAINRSPEADALINTLVQLGRDLGLRTLAEGVETSDQVDHLRNEQVNLAQGYLFARPLDTEAFELRFLATPGLISSVAEATQT